MTTIDPDKLPQVHPDIPYLKYELRMGVIYPGINAPHYFSTTQERWEQDAAIYLRYGEVAGQDRIVWLESRSVTISEWAGGL